MLTLYTTPVIYLAMERLRLKLGGGREEPAVEPEKLIPRKLPERAPRAAE